MLPVELMQIEFVLSSVWRLARELLLCARTVLQPEFQTRCCLVLTCDKSDEE